MRHQLPLDRTQHSFSVVQKHRIDAVPALCFQGHNIDIVLRVSQILFPLPLSFSGSNLCTPVCVFQLFLHLILLALLFCGQLFDVHHVVPVKLGLVHKRGDAENGIPGKQLVHVCVQIVGILQLSPPCVQGLDRFEQGAEGILENGIAQIHKAPSVRPRSDQLAQLG